MPKCVSEGIAIQTGKYERELRGEARVRHAVCYPHLRIQQTIMHTEKYDRELVDTPCIALIHVAKG